MDSQQGSDDLFSEGGYKHRKQQAIFHLRHAIEQGEKDQWFNALVAISHATYHATAACQSIVNRSSWTTPKTGERS